ncbi:DUF4907 domain-containing protein [Flagellimonas olearia]|uniref:DUF4907 domain-containing protein n=2 Tax=Flagellimonas olearia TaxID=552546 RepID=A0A6I1E0N8_9FLAO|nr:DUF4907 domain-containing protein [Allomuricauda olearia]
MGSDNGGLSKKNLLGMKGLGSNTMAKTMMMVLLMFIGATIIGLGFLFKKSSEEEDKAQFRTEVIKVGNGYGYQIFYGDRLLIQQECIPVLRGNVPFQNPEDATSVAGLVVEKIAERQSPELSLEDIKALDVVILTP